MAYADATIRSVVSGIKAPSAWHRGSNAIVVVWDENN
jgi:hypothetical protein